MKATTYPWYKWNKDDTIEVWVDIDVLTKIAHMYKEKIEMTLKLGLYEEFFSYTEELKNIMLVIEEYRKSHPAETNCDTKKEIEELLNTPFGEDDE